MPPEDLRIYQYQSDCLAHLHDPDLPVKGNWVVQMGKQSGKNWWKNMSQPFATEKEALDCKEELLKRA